ARRGHPPGAGRGRQGCHRRVVRPDSRQDREGSRAAQPGAAGTARGRGTSETPTRRGQLVIESRRAVERDGRDASTRRSIANAMGIKAPSLYKHVRDREEIELLLTEVAFDEMGEALASAGPELDGIGRAYRSWAMANPGLYRIATGGPLDRDR